MSRRVDKITDEAALWFVRAQNLDFSGEDRRELASWFAGSAEHVQEYLSVAAIRHEIREVAAAYDVDQLVDLAREASDDRNVVALPGPDVSRPHRVNEDAGLNAEVTTAEAGSARRRRSVLWAAVTSLVLAIAAGSFGYLQVIAPDSDLYTTGVGEQVSFPLADGSVVTLNAQSRLRVAYTDEFRDVHLIIGEAMFDVGKDPEQPFRVITDRAVIRAVGTEFNVRNRGTDTTVTVVEGIVDVRSKAGRASLPGSGARLPAPNDRPTVLSEPTRLKPGQQATVNGGEVAVIETNVQRATSWRERRLVFEALALKDVVTEFNLYNDQQFVIDDAGLAERAISGVFDADDRESFALFLSEAGLALAETRADGTIVLRSRKGPE